MLDFILLSITCSSIILIIYHHIGYPLLLKYLVRSSFFSKRKEKSQEGSPEEKEANLHDIAVLMPAYNEEKWIADKIRNLATLIYPSQKLRVILACDGCTDHTAQVARQTMKELWNQDLTLVILEFPKNEGKVATINKSMRFIHEEIVALTDVSALISLDALFLASHHFQDPRLGIINSHYTLLNPTPGEKKYWEYQSKIKQDEAHLGTLLGAHGALYLFKFNLFTPLKEDTINDDFILPMTIIAQGFQAKTVDNIFSVEMEPSNPTENFKRRLRIGAGNCQQLFRLIKLLHPKYGSTAFAFASSKGLRVIMPFLMITAFIGSLYFVSWHWLFIAAALGQLGLYFCVLIWWITKRIPKHALAQSLHYLVAGHCANFIGSLRYMLGLEKKAWSRVSSRSLKED